MKSRLIVFLLLFSVIGDRSPVIGIDAVPPAAIVNLAAQIDTSAGGKINLSWTSPGDDRMLGTAQAYILKYSFSEFGDTTTWAEATEYAQTWPPQGYSNHGLRGKYYDNNTGDSFDNCWDEKKLAGTRIDRTVDMTWGASTAGEDDGADFYSKVYADGHANGEYNIKWEGYLLCKSSGAHTFFVRYDDGARLTVDNKVLFNEWNPIFPPPTLSSTTIIAEPGWYPIKLEYHSHNGPGRIRLAWWPPKGSGYTIIPEENLRPEPITRMEGLLGRYYDKDNFTDFQFYRFDPSIDLYYYNWPPDITRLTDKEYDEDIFDDDYANKAEWSVRWEGMIKIDYAETYYFSGWPEEQTKVWIDDNLLTSPDFDINLTEGWHRLRIDYWQGDGDGSEASSAGKSKIQLKWRAPNNGSKVPEQVVPADHLCAPRNEFYALTGLEPAKKYYIAIKTIDEAENQSEISNVVDCYTDDEYEDNDSRQDARNVQQGKYKLYSADWDWYTIYLYRGQSVKVVTDKASLRLRLEEFYQTPVDEGKQSVAYTVPEQGGYGEGWYRIGISTGNMKMKYTMDIDYLPPANINDLFAEEINPGQVRLTWTAPGDDGMSGQIADGRWQIAYSTISDFGFRISDFQLEIPTSCFPGSSHSWTVTGLQEGISYYFAIRTADEGVKNRQTNTWVHCWSGFSNVVKCPDLTSPAPIADLSALPGDNDGEIKLTWTAVGDDGTVGAATGYILKYSTTSEITSNAEWNSATPYSQTWIPQSAGATENETLVGLKPGTPYWLAIKAVDEVNQEGDLSNPCCCQAKISLPTKPSSFSGVALSTTTIKWTWEDSLSEEGYRIEDAKRREQKAELPANTTSWLETDLSPNIQYSRRIYAYNSAGKTYSELVSVYTLTSIPTGFTSLYQGRNTITLSWSGDGSRYAIERSNDGTHYSCIVEWADGVTSPGFVDTDLEENTTYWYRVSAYNGDQILSEPSASIQTLTVSGALNAPSDFCGIALSTTTIRWEWEDNERNETGYRLKDAESSEQKAELTANTTFYVETGLQPNTSYWRYVEVFILTSTAVSNTDIKYTFASVPSNLTYTAGVTEIWLQWQGNATRYRIERRTGIDDFGLLIDDLEKTTYTDTGLAEETTYWYRVAAYNGDQVLTQPSEPLAAKTLKSETPQISLEQDQVFETARPTISGVTQPGAQIFIWLDGKQLPTPVIADKNGNWSWTPPESLEQGEHHIRVKAELGDWDSGWSSSYCFFCVPPEETFINYPNPFNPAIEPTIIRYYLTQSGKVKLAIYDLFGGLVWGKTENGAQGENKIFWWGKNDKEKIVADGVYIAVLKVAGEKKIKKRKIAVLKR